MKLAVLLPITLCGCVVASGSAILPNLIVAVVPAARVEGGDGGTGDAARTRLDARAKAARIEAARGALEAATRAPNDLRLQRRAAAMARALAGDADAKAVLAIEPVLERLVREEPCPGLIDAAATWHAFGESSRGGDAYLRAASQCDSVEAAIAAVVPLRAADRCDDAVAGLRAAWPRINTSRRGAWIDVFDAVAACSDAVTLRRNLSFAPPDVVGDYFALLARRRAEAAERDRRRAEEYRAEQATNRAREASWRCESECNSAIGSCNASCGGDTSCMQRCSSLGHVCRSGCGL